MVEVGLEGGGFCLFCLVLIWRGEENAFCPMRCNNCPQATSINTPIFDSPILPAKIISLACESCLLQCH